MATKTIDQLPSSAPLTGTEVLPIVQGNETLKTTVQDIANLAGLAGTNFIYVAANGTDTANATALSAAYITAKTMSPSATNRITIVAAPGYYNFNSLLGFAMDTQYIDLVSLDGNRSIIFNGIGTIFINSDNTYVKGVNTLSLPFEVGSGLPSIKLENCKGGNLSLGANSGFILSGTFINCEMGNLSFGTSNTTISGTFINCIAGSGSFGGGGTASGIFNNCVGGNGSFGNTASGTFINCTAGEGSFGGNGTASGIFTSCVGGPFSFGGNLMGTLSGKLFYCRLTNNGTFNLISPGGYTIYCIDGNNNPNNQGFITQNKL
jgi:hypothetical protein